MALSAKQRRLLEDALADRGEAQAIADVLDAPVPADGSITTAKLAAQSVTLAKLARGTDGQIIVGQTGADPAYKTVSGDVTAAASGALAVNASIKQQTVAIPIENLGAAGAIATRPIFARLNGCTLVRASLLAQDAFAGVDATNTIVVTLAKGAGTIATVTFDDGSSGVVPVNNDLNGLGTLDPTHKILASDEVVTINIACAGTADPPAMLLLLDFTPTNI